MSLKETVEIAQTKKWQKYVPEKGTCTFVYISLPIIDAEVGTVCR